MKLAERRPWLGADYAGSLGAADEQLIAKDGRHVVLKTESQILDLERESVKAYLPLDNE